MAQKLAQRVRDFISKKADPFSAQEITDYLGLTTGRSVRHVIDDMCDRGEVERLARGLFRYIPEWRSARGNRRTIKPRIYRAMHVRGAFSPREVEVLSEATRDFIRKVIKSLLKAGAIEPVCKRRNPSSHNMEWVYRVKNRDRFYLEYVKPSHEELEKQAKGIAPTFPKP